MSDLKNNFLKLLLNCCTFCDSVTRRHHESAVYEPGESDQVSDLLCVSQVL